MVEDLQVWIKAGGAQAHRLHPNSDMAENLAAKFAPKQDNVIYFFVMVTTSTDI